MENEAKKTLELYIHVPFCVKKCDYCDFLSGPAGKERQREYFQALEREIAAVPDFQTGRSPQFLLRRNTFRPGSVSCWRDAGSDQK